MCESIRKWKAVLLFGFGSTRPLLLLKFALMSWDSKAGLAFYVGFTQTLQRKKKRSTSLPLLFPLPGVFFLLIFIYLLPILELSCVFLNYQEMAAL